MVTKKNAVVLASVPPETGIQLLDRSIKEAEELLRKGEVSDVDKQLWENTARDYLVRAFSSESPNVSAVLRLGRRSFDIDGDDEYFAQLRRAELTDMAKALLSVRKLLELEIELSKHCERCGTRQRLDNNFCENCGLQFQTNLDAVTQKLIDTSDVTTLTSDDNKEKEETTPSEEFFPEELERLILVHLFINPQRQSSDEIRRALIIEHLAMAQYHLEQLRLGGLLTYWSPPVRLSHHGPSGYSLSQRGREFVVKAGLVE